MQVINGHTLNIERYGPAHGPAVVLLHHGLGSVRSWRNTIPALAEAGYHTIAYDRWGYGRSDPRPRLSVPFFSDDLQDLDVILDTFGVERVFLVGHSDGGTIALYYAAQYPQHVAGLVSIAAHIYVESKMEPGVEEVLRSFEHDTHFRERLRRLHGAKADDVFYNWYNGWMRPETRQWDMRQQLRGIQCPSLIVQGMEDERATPQHARDIAQAIHGAELWLEPGVGHMLPQDVPEAFNQRLLAFLSAQPLTQ